MQYFAVEGSDYVSNRYDFITNEADERPSANAKFGNILYCKDTGNEYIYDGTAWQEYKMRYKDLGLVIDATNVAAGAVVLMPTWITNAQWVRNVSALTSADQIPAVVVNTKDSSGFSDWGIQSANLQNTGTAYGRLALSTSHNTSLSGLGSKELKFGIKNTSASIATFMKLRIQLFGL